MDGFKAVSRRSEARILVIDDEAAVLRVVAEGLEALGHRVWTADSGEDGLTKLQRIRADVVICDLSMPGMDGLEVATRIRCNSETSGRPKPAFLMLTGWTDVLTREKTRQAGVEDIVLKPVTLSDLGDKINRFIHGTEASPLNCE